ncbi:ATP-dependent DNA helicase Q-like 3 isoform X2 [Gigantopelta aegis]|nr:ATP-dependent DNA helicase Q-like 3 isoform X2 [Gigantopelta aegis]
MYTGKLHTSLVVSPLTSLIKTQVKSLRDHNISAHGIYEHMESESVNDIKQRKSTVLFSSPEAITSKYLKNIVQEVYGKKLCVIAYDEAHCISEWGLDFRDDYRKVNVHQSIFECPALILTATATSDIKADIDTVLGLTDANVICSLPDRPNIMISKLKSTEKYDEELKWIKDGILQHGVLMATFNTE